MMSYDDILNIMRNIRPYLMDWNIDIDTLDITIIVSRNVGGMWRYISYTIPYDDLSSAADPLGFLTSIVEKLKDQLSKDERLY